MRSHPSARLLFPPAPPRRHRDCRQSSKPTLWAGRSPTETAATIHVLGTISPGKYHPKSIGGINVHTHYQRAFHRIDRLIVMRKSYPVESHHAFVGTNPEVPIRRLRHRGGRDKRVVLIRIPDPQHEMVFERSSRAFPTECKPRQKCRAQPDHHSLQPQHRDFAKQR